MAKEVLTKLIDDLDGGKAAETVTFALDGRIYEIDLSAKNAAKLRHILTPYAQHGQSSSSRPARAPSRKPKTPTGPDQNQAIRAWAARKGYEVAPRGRIKRDIVEEYRQSIGAQ